jgi:hypothetical protein
MTNKEQDTAPNVTAKDANQRSVQREEHPIEAMPDEYGNVRDIDKSKYPDDSAAAKGTATPPSGQGGQTPKSRPDYQDQFPANPEPSEHAKAWAEKIREVGAVQAHSDAINEAAKGDVKQEGPSRKEQK